MSINTKLLVLEHIARSYCIQVIPTCYFCLYTYSVLLTSNTNRVLSQYISNRIVLKAYRIGIHSLYLKIVVYASNTTMIILDFRLPSSRYYLVLRHCIITSDLYSSCTKMVLLQTFVIRTAILHE